MCALQLDTSDGMSSEIGDDALLIWIDETGNEDLSDKNYPLFGLGGCVVEAGHYLKAVSQPWQRIRRKVFGDVSSLHANELHPTNQQIAALSRFFDYGAFGRVASIVPASARIAPSLETYQACSVALGHRISAVANHMHYSSVVLLVEDSERGNVSAEKWLGRISVSRSYNGGPAQEVPMQHFFLPKHLNEPGLEVADFIVHTAGREGRARNRESAEVKDFAHVFAPLRKRLASFMYVQRAETNPA